MSATPGPVSTPGEVHSTGGPGSAAVWTVS